MTKPRRKKPVGARITSMASENGSKINQGKKFKKLGHYDKVCPSCEVSLIGSILPKKDQKYYGVKYFMRQIGIYDWDLDRTVRWRCPDCAHEWVVS